MPVCIKATDRHFEHKLPWFWWPVSLAGCALIADTRITWPVTSGIDPLPTLDIYRYFPHLVRLLTACLAVEACWRSKFQITSLHFWRGQSYCPTNSNFGWRGRTSPLSLMDWRPYTWHHVWLNGIVNKLRLTRQYESVFTWWEFFAVSTQHGFTCLCLKFHRFSVYASRLSRATVGNCE